MPCLLRLQKTVVGKAEIVAFAAGQDAHNEVVEQLDVQQLSGFGYASGQFLIGLARLQAARRVVVHHGYRHSVVLKRSTVDDA